MSHARSFSPSPRWIAASASTMVRLLISRMNELTEVKGMSYTSCGVRVPGTDFPRYRM